MCVPVRSTRVRASTTRRGCVTQWGETHTYEHDLDFKTLIFTPGTMDDDGAATGYSFEVYDTNCYVDDPADSTTAINLNLGDDNITKISIGDYARSVAHLPPPCARPAAVVVVGLRCVCGVRVRDGWRVGAGVRRMSLLTRGADDDRDDGRFDRFDRPIAEGYLSSASRATV